MISTANVVQSLFSIEVPTRSRVYVLLGIWFLMSPSLILCLKILILPRCFPREPHLCHYLALRLRHLSCVLSKGAKRTPSCIYCSTVHKCTIGTRLIGRAFMLRPTVESFTQSTLSFRYEIFSGILGRLSKVLYFGP